MESVVVTYLWPTLVTVAGGLITWVFKRVHTRLDELDKDMGKVKIGMVNKADKDELVGLTKEFVEVSTRLTTVLEQQSKSFTELKEEVKTLR